jgi:hypothetical protein
MSNMPGWLRWVGTPEGDRMRAEGEARRDMARLILHIGRRELLKQGADPQLVDRIYKRAVYRVNLMRFC